MEITLHPIGFVRSARPDPEDDNWGNTHAVIELVDTIPPDALNGLTDFSHAEIIFHFHRVDPARIVTGARHPRNNPAWPAVGIFAQRGKNRPNRLGLTTVRIVAVDGRRLHVAELDAIDGTPVLDIKPLMQEFQPRSPQHQPDWVGGLMQDYWRKEEGRRTKDEPDTPAAAG